MNQSAGIFVAVLLLTSCAAQPQLPVDARIDNAENERSLVSFNLIGQSPPTRDQWRRIILEKWYGDLRFAHFHANGDLKPHNADELDQTSDDFGDLFRRVCAAGQIGLAWKIVNETPKELSDEITFIYVIATMTDAGQWKEAVKLIGDPPERFATEDDESRQNLLPRVVNRLVNAGDLSAAHQVLQSVKVDALIQPDGSMTAEQIIRMKMIREIAAGMSRSDIDGALDFARKELVGREWARFLGAQIREAARRNNVELAIRLASLSNNPSIVDDVCYAIGGLVLHRGRITTVEQLTDFALSLDRDYAIRSLCSQAILFRDQNRNPVKELIVARCAKSIREEGLDGLGVKTKVRAIDRMAQYKRFEDAIHIENDLMSESMGPAITSLDAGQYRNFVRGLWIAYTELGDSLGEMARDDQPRRAEKLLKSIKHDEGRLICALQLIQYQFLRAIRLQDKTLLKDIRTDARKLVEQFDVMNQKGAEISPNQEWWFKLASLAVAITQDDETQEDFIADVRLNGIPELVDQLLKDMTIVEFSTGLGMQGAITFARIEDQTRRLEEILDHIVRTHDTGQAMEFCSQLKLNEKDEREVHLHLMRKYSLSDDSEDFLSYAEALAGRFPDFDFDDRSSRGSDGPWFVDNHPGELDKQRLKRLSEALPKTRFLRSMLTGFHASEGDPQQALEFLREDVRLANENKLEFAITNQRVFWHLCDRGFINETIAVLVQLDHSSVRTGNLSAICKWLVNHNNIEPAMELVQRQIELPEDRARIYADMAWYIEKRLP